MTDLHARCVAEVTRLRAIAEAEYIATWSPPMALRVCDWAEDVLSRHEPWADSAGRDVCFQCNRACHSRSGIMCHDPDGPWPCDDVRAVARALGIAVMVDERVQP